MKTTFFALLIFAAHAAQAADLIVCLREVPQWAYPTQGKWYAQGRGPGILIDHDKGEVTWIATGSYVRVTGIDKPKGKQIIRVEGSLPVAEKITSYDSKALVYETMPPSYGKRITATLKSQDGGTGQLSVTLKGATPTSTFVGQGSYSDTSFEKESFAYCTTNVRSN